jgi:hypothetical protein
MNVLIMVIICKLIITIITIIIIIFNNNYLICFKLIKWDKAWGVTIIYIKIIMHIIIMDIDKLLIVEITIINKIILIIILIIIIIIIK